MLGYRLAQNVVLVPASGEADLAEIQLALVANVAPLHHRRLAAIAALDLVVENDVRVATLPILRLTPKLLYFFFIRQLWVF